MKYTKTKVNRLYSGIASVRSYIVTKALTQGKGLEIVCGGASMKLEPQELVKGKSSSEFFVSKFDGKKYYLIDYIWKYQQH